MMEILNRGEGEAGNACISHGRLLIVDDEIDTLRPLCEILEEWGYQVLHATSGKNALEILETEEVDLLVTDLSMPEMNGIELLRTACERDRDLVCIIITAYGTIQRAVDAMSAGAFDFVLKPFDFKMLRSKISRAVEMRKLRDSEAIYRSIVENFQSELICRFLPDGTLNFVNQAFSRSLAKRKQDIVGSTYLSFLCEEDRDRIIGVIASLDPDNPVVRLEYRVKAPFGEIRWQRWTFTAILDGNNQVAVIQAIGSDIHDLKIAEEQLTKKENELRKKMKDLEDFYQTAVSRELRMKELKEEIKELQRELERQKNK
ncbi:MAG: response regulator [Thermodesulfovibrionales bacterium]|nr:response regulator [Thermodesulfovibrionales bacterium]